jgi:tRNA pseudouridine synthase 10
MVDYAPPVRPRVEEAAPAASVDPVSIQKAVERGLCDACLGRLLGGGRGEVSSDERGRAARETIGAARLAPEACPVCDGLSSELDALSAAVVEALRDHEYTTFLIGCTLDEVLARRDAELAASLGFPAPQPLKQEITREVGLRVERATGKTVDFKDPDIAAVVDGRFNTVRLQVKSAYFRGRYRKLARGVPQTRWPCRFCRGRGCIRCGGTGKMYPDSVEEYIAGPLIEALGGEDHALHGAGREDIDALMLGDGRPFVVEIRRPHTRSTDLRALEATIAKRSQGRVEVSGLAACAKESVAALKSSDWRKTYRVLVALEKDIKDDQIYHACSKLTGTVVSQQTPTRVLHRRADIPRKRTVERVEVARRDGPLVELLVTGESGLYIKELIHGDEGRTQPNLAELLGVPCEVRELDVIQIHDA